MPRHAQPHMVALENSVLVQQEQPAPRALNDNAEVLRRILQLLIRTNLRGVVDSIGARQQPLRDIQLGPDARKAVAGLDDVPLGYRRFQRFCIWAQNIAIIFMMV